MVRQLRKSVLGTTVTAAMLWLATGAVSFAQGLPAPPEMAAKVMELTGRVSVLRNGDSEEWALNVGDAVQVKQVIVTGPDGFARFQVSDGSTFEVYPNSTVTFRKNGGDWREISVRGTTFDVSVDPDNESTLIAVEEGVVEVRHALKGGEAKTVNAGESLQVYKNQPLAFRTIDRGVVAQKIFRALEDALYNIALNSRGPRIPGTCIDCGGQTRPLPPPPPPPAPPAPPH
jgi:ferric-dicitrate binding protein FerR (iron transport regulator)